MVVGCGVQKRDALAVTLNSSTVCHADEGSILSGLHVNNVALLALLRCFLRQHDKRCWLLLERIVVGFLPSQQLLQRR
jgi:hypothetical protein